MQIIYSKEFDLNYAKIQNYYEYTYNENVFKKLDNELGNKKEVLLIFPTAFEVYKGNYRKIVINNYIIIYTIIDEEIIVFINIYHGSENYLMKI